MQLPRDAFLPQRNLSDNEREQFRTKRSELFATRSPPEQRCIVELAKWYAAQRHRLPYGALLGNAAEAVFYHRYLPHFGRKKPGPLTVALAKVAHIITTIDSRRSPRLQARFYAELERYIARGEGTTLFGVVYFLRALPLEIGTEGQQDIEARLDTFAARCAGATGGPALQRLKAAIRTHQNSNSAHDRGNLGWQLWELLLAVAEQDMQAAVGVVDTHWAERTSPVFSRFELRDSPELAYQLAVRFKPFRPAVAAVLLGGSISWPKFTLDKLVGAEFHALQKILDASCQLLADWVRGDEALGAEVTFDSLRILFRQGA